MMIKPTAGSRTITSKYLLSQTGAPKRSLRKSGKKLGTVSHLICLASFINSIHEHSYKTLYINYRLEHFQKCEETSFPRRKYILHKGRGRSQAMKDFQALLVDRDEDDIHRAHTARGKVRSNFFSHDVYVCEHDVSFHRH